MDRAAALLKKLREVKRKAAQEMHIEKMILFGSQARGQTQKDSDVDLIIVSRDFRGLNFFQRGAQMYKYWNLRMPVDFLCYTPEEFEKFRKQRTIVREAVATGIAV